MTQFFDPARFARTYRDPVAIAILAVDLFPIYAVLALGWNAAALVFLYWLENLVIGAFALARMTATSAKDGIAGIAQMAFVGPFFIVHFGMFCFVHGQFLNFFARGEGGVPEEDFFLGPIDLISEALSTGDQMAIFLGAIIALQIYLFARDYIGRGQFQDTTVGKEMSAPYGRIVLLHFGLFIGMAAMIALGQPMIGILALILLRALWGMVFTLRRRMQMDNVST